MKPRTLILVLFLAACEAPDPVDVPKHAPTYVTDRNNLVLGDATAPGQFEVIYRAGDSASHLWCAAGEYGGRALGLQVTRRIYVVKPLSRSVRRPNNKSVVFTVLPKEEHLGFERPPNDYSMTVTRIGESQTIGAARHLCQQLPRRFPWLWLFD